MSKIELLLLIVFLLLLILLFKYLQTKRQIRNLSKQIAELVNGKSEKMLDISLIDKDLEQLAGILNQYRTIGRAVRLSENTVRKYVAGLEEKGLICTEPSTVTTKDGRMRNGSLIYNIRPIQEALEQNYQRQFRQAERDMERARAEKRLAELNRQNKKEESA